MKALFSVLAATAAFSVLAGEAAASIPPPAWNAPTWTGPAKVCAEAFAFSLAAGEDARQGYPTVGVIRYGVETSRGPLEITEYWAASPPEVTPEVEDREGGKLRPLQGKPRDEGLTVGYLFQPDDAKGLPVSVQFLPPAKGGWAGKDIDAVLKRIAFGRIVREGCTEPTR